MGRTRKLKKVLKTDLKTVCPRVHYGDSNSDEGFPYIDFILSPRKNQYRRDYELEIIIWDKAVGAAEIEDLADDVEDLFDDYYHLDDDMLIKSYLNIRNDPEEDEKRLKRRRLVFELQHYERSTV